MQRAQGHEQDVHFQLEIQKIIISHLVSCSSKSIETGHVKFFGSFWRMAKKMYEKIMHKDIVLQNVLVGLHTCRSEMFGGVQE